MSQKSHRKASSAQGKPSKPGLQTRRSSGSHGNQSLSTKPGLNSSRKTGPDIVYRNNEPNEDSMAAGLPQFCATCEKQIVTPGLSILYCSEFCRKKDASRPLSMHATLSPSATIPTAASYFDTPQPNIVEPHSPTVLRPASVLSSDVSGADSDSPVEEPEGSDISISTEAARYLAQFHSQSYIGERIRPRPLKTNRNSSATDGIPSLSHTPSSSIGTMASIERSLPRKYDDFSSRSPDLVMPFYGNLPSSNPRQNLKNESVESSTSTLTEGHVAVEGNESYQRRIVNSDDQSQPSSGLKQLFRHNGITSHSSKPDVRSSQVVDANGRYEDATVGI